jgi:hypothetical protein
VSRGVTRAGGLILVVLVACLTGGCGGGDDESSATAWADGVCTAITSWSASVTSTTDALRDGVTNTEALTGAVDDFESATDDFLEELRGLGAPETDAGAQAKESIDQLSDEIDDGVAQIDDAVDDASGVSGILDAVSKVTGSLSAMSSAVSSTYTTLAGLEPGGELEQAFRDADSCDDVGG